MQIPQLLRQQGTQVYRTLYFLRKLKSRRTFSGSAAIPAHTTATAMHFPADAGLIFLTDELTNDRFLVDTGATLSIILFLALQTPARLAPFSKEQTDNLSALGDSPKELFNSKANFLPLVFCKPLWQVPYWASTF
jgi:hypothetical protein